MCGAMQRRRHEHHQGGRERQQAHISCDSPIDLQRGQGVCGLCVGVREQMGPRQVTPDLTVDHLTVSVRQSTCEGGGHLVRHSRGAIWSLTQSRPRATVLYQVVPQSTDERVTCDDKVAKSSTWVASPKCDFQSRRLPCATPRSQVRLPHA